MASPVGAAGSGGRAMIATVTTSMSCSPGRPHGFALTWAASSLGSVCPCARRRFRDRVRIIGQPLVVEPRGVRCIARSATHRERLRLQLEFSDLAIAVDTEAVLACVE